MYYIPKFIFSIERLIHPGDKAQESSPSFKTMIENAFSYEINGEVINRIVLIRNSWLHGVSLYDKIVYNNQEISFDYKFIFESLTIVKNWMMRSTRDFKESINTLTKFGNACCCFYALRLVEITYKLLDKRLLTKEKLDTRIIGANNAYYYIEESPKDFLKLAEELIETGEIDFKVKASKFADCKPRTTKVEKLNIVRLHSDSGFKIGDFQTPQTDLALALISLDENFQNKVNGIYVKDYFKKD